MALSLKITFICACALALVGFAPRASAQDYTIQTWYCTPGYPDCEDVDGLTLVPVAAATATAECNNGLPLGLKIVVGLKSGTHCSSPVVATATGGVSSFVDYEEVDGCEVAYTVGEVVVTGTVYNTSTILYSTSGTQDCQGGLSLPEEWDGEC